MTTTRAEKNSGTWREKMTSNCAKAVDNVTPVGDLAWALEEPTYQFCAHIDPGEEHLFMDVCEHVEHTRWTPSFCDVIPAGGGKPAGIAAACARWGLDPAECAAFGDGGNDVPMFGCVGTAVAMGNAVDEVKAAASFVAPDIDDQGLIVACRQLGLIWGGWVSAGVSSVSLRFQLSWLR